MRRQVISRTTVVWFVLALTAACGSDDTGDAQPPLEMGTEQDESCPIDAPEFVTGPAGLTESDEAQGIKVRLDEAEHDPPQRDYNTWTLAVTDLANAPLPSPTLTWACAWMAKHGHGSVPKTVAWLPDGRLELGSMNLSMNGGWDVQLWISPSGGAPFAGSNSGGARSPRACTAPTGAEANIVFKTCVPREL